MKQMDAYIGLRGSHNITEQADVPTEKMKMIAKKMRPVQDRRVQKTKWVVLRWPTPAMAQLASMSTEAFEDFFFERKTFPGVLRHVLMLGFRVRQCFAASLRTDEKNERQSKAASRLH